ncbi:helix-turn-helix domain-containing protein [Gabonibacter massiliensis]|uniref:helix-turn-helix domain-containing protein n=1 Tax=Gabonibacter massiliensis TaxID=1720195 RepID=UPI00073F0A48
MKSVIELYIISEVKKRRKKLKMSQRYIADCLNVSRSFIRDIENLKKDSAYNVDHINELARVLGCSPRELWPEKPL